jgi:hypothetical protein
MDNVRSSSPQPPAGKPIEPVLRPQSSREDMDQLPDWYRKLMASNPESDHWIHTLASHSNLMIERDPQHSNPVTEHYPLHSNPVTEHYPLHSNPVTER